MSYIRIPESWHMELLSDCAKVQTGIAKGRKVDENEALTLPYLRVANVQDGYLDLAEIKYITIRKRELERFLLKSGDVLLTEGGDFDKLGRGSIWNGEIDNCVHQNHVFAVRVNIDKLLPEFFSYQSQSSYGKRYFLSVAHRTTNLACINTTKLKAFPVLIPLLNEQKKIAYVLSKVQDAIATQEQLIQTTTELKKALMQKLFTEGLHSEPQKETEIGPMPESWEAAAMGSFCQLSTGTTPSTKNADYYIGTNPFIKTNQIVNSRISKTDIFISDEAISKYKLKVFPPNTVLIAMYGQGKTRGQVALLDISASITQNAGAITPDDSILPEFLYYYLFSQYSRLRSSGMEGHISHLNLGFLRSFVVPKPSSTDEQQEIIKIISTIIQKIELHKNRREALQDLFRTLLHQLMTAQIRVHDVDLPGF